MSTAARPVVALSLFVVFAGCSSTGGTSSRDGGLPVDASAGHDVGMDSRSSGDAKQPSDASNATTDAKHTTDASNVTTDASPMRDAQKGDAAIDAGSGDAGADGPLSSPGDAAHEAGPLLLTGVAMVASSPWAYHRCALLAAGTLACWGQNGNGELGLGSATGPEMCGTDPCAQAPVAVPGVSGVASVAVGLGQTYAVMSDATVMGWGAVSASATPTVVPNLVNVHSIGASSDTFYAVLNDGTVVSWSPTGPVMTTAVPGLTGVTAVAGGQGFACFLVSGGTVVCEGVNDTAQLGDGTFGSFQASPGPVVGVTSATAIGAGESFACALEAGGAVDCWGAGAELGSGGSGPDNCELGCIDNCPTCAETPVTAIASGATALAAGNDFVCALKADGSVECWGKGGFGELGTTNGIPGFPAAVSGISGAMSVSGGAYTGCAVVTGGRVDCWGSNDDGVLGCGAACQSLSMSPPVAVLE